MREIIQENRVLCPGNVNSPSFILDDSSIITIEPSNIERWEKVSEALPSFSSIISDHNAPNNIKVDSAHSSKCNVNGLAMSEESDASHDEEEYLGKALEKVDEIQGEMINTDSWDGILETVLVPDTSEADSIALSSIQLVSDEEIEGLSSSPASSSSAVEQKDTERTHPSSCESMKHEVMLLQNYFSLLRYLYIFLLT